MNTKIDLSIIILTHNNPVLLETCICSIVAHTKAINYEIIVIANNCTDNTAEMVRKRFRGAAVIETETNEGFCQANNRGIKVARGEYLLLLNDDTEILDQALDILVKFMRENKNVGISGPLLLNPDGSPQRQGGLLGKKFWKAKRPTPCDFVIGAALIIRRETLNQIGPLDEKLYFYNDDLDWCLSARKVGWKVYIVPEAKVIHYGGWSTKRTFSRKHFVEGFKGGLYFCKKHYGPVVFGIYKVLLLILLPIAIAFAFIGMLLFRGEFKEKVKAYLEVYRFVLSSPL
ncbi:MAG: glycosyltransferase [Candidatus Margulisbacteria bacterium]|nr:glycosyltransferase [Candidatus Margulisiibacteriota bacterium]MBU1022220.1 glycosyltransferase [Candidatus Margulisiibacteriota bacterium]MBU1729341.1 glycosyltransferase [Candidatus Margulisiibacteriota bacterium]MBU1955614.1 glycosyltransferase [Candidatus Margulisiibacteriota bacterium]